MKAFVKLCFWGMLALRGLSTYGLWAQVPKETLLSPTKPLKPPYKQVLSINPASLLTGTYMLGYERHWKPGWSLQVQAGLVSEYGLLPLYAIVLESPKHIGGDYRLGYVATAGVKWYVVKEARVSNGLANNLYLMPLFTFASVARGTVVETSCKPIYYDRGLLLESQTTNLGALLVLGYRHPLPLGRLSLDGQMGLGYELFQNFEIKRDPDPDCMQGEVVNAFQLTSVPKLRSGFGYSSGYSHLRLMNGLLCRLQFTIGVGF